MQAYRWGIIGPGKIARQFASALQELDDGTLYAVASRNEIKARKFANEFAAQKSYGSYADLLADPNVDFVYIATPHSHHFPLAKACLEAGKHLLLEKPLTVNAAQTASLIDIAQSRQLVLQEALWSRFMPCFSQVRKWIEEGQIGQVQYIQSQIGFARAHYKDHRLTRADLAGGGLLDLGVYCISLSQFLLQQNPDSVSAMGQINQDQVDQNTLVTLHYPGGAYSQFVCSIGAESSNSMTIHGSEGRITVPSLFWNGTAASLYKGDEFELELSFPHQTNGFEYQIKGAMNAASEGKLCDERMNHADSLNVMQTMDEIRRQINLSYPSEIESGA